MSGASHLNGFSGYKNVTNRIMNDLKTLNEISQKLSLQGNSDLIQETINHLATDTFGVAVIGEFNRGKSTVINALIGKGILPMDILPTTATLNKITFSVEPYIDILYKNGMTEQIGIEQLESYVTKLSKEYEEKAKTISEATVYYPVNYCKNGVTIIDTPGLNDENAMTEVTLSVLSKVDAAIMVIMADAPFSDSERAFLESKVITADLGKVLFVVTGIDKLEEDDVVRVLNHIRNSIQERILAKAESVYGKDSAEYEAYARKIGRIQIYGVSAKRALKAKKEGDDALLNRSQFPVFEAALERFLSEDRAAVVLNAPISRIRRASIEILKAAKLRDSALQMESEAFDEKYQIALEEIGAVRVKRQEELEKIRVAAKRTYDKLLPKINNFWKDIEDAAINALTQYNVSANDVKKGNIEATQRAMNKAVQNAMSQKSQNILEQVQDSIYTELEKEADRLSEFESSFYEASERIQNLFVSTDIKTAKSGEIVMSTAVNYLTLGIGSAYLGYKEAGWKGALLGGITGGVTTFGGSMLAGVLVGLLSLPMTLPVLVIGGILGSIVGIFAGRGVTDLFFADVKIERLKKGFREEIIKEIALMKRDSEIATKIRKQIDDTFQALENKVRTETEKIMGDTEQQLIQLKGEVTQNHATSEREKEIIGKMLKDVDEICLYANELEGELTKILTK